MSNAQFLSFNRIAQEIVGTTQMDSQEFERRYKETIDKLGNQLQAIAAALAQIDDNLGDIRFSIQNLNRLLEEYRDPHRGDS